MSLTLAATLLGVTADQADAAKPCRVKTSTHVESSKRLAGGALLRRYSATARGAAVGGYDQSGKVVMTSFPKDAVPVLINSRVGLRSTVGEMVRHQRRHAMAAVNGDFFAFPDIRGVKSIEMSRGPMVRNGHILRATADRKRVVGVTQRWNPFGGMLGVRGTVSADGIVKSISIRSVNWHNVRSGGVNIYTSAWSDHAPRPKGRLEWVLDRQNRIQQVRSRARHDADRGAAVKPGTRVLAFPKDVADRVRGANVGMRVDVSMHQSTGTGTRLRTAVGRGVPLVVGGTPAPLGCGAYAHSKAARPRTFVGWTARGNWRTFTVPGSTFDGVGLRTGGFGLANAANIAESLGMQRAYELDGGGSTTLWTRSRKGDWSRRDLYSVNTRVCACERPTPNGLAFVQH